MLARFVSEENAMAAVTGGLYEAQRVKLDPSDEGVEEQVARVSALGSFAGLGGALKQLPTVPQSHASLTRTVWVRRVLEQWAAQQRFTVARGESGANAGQLVLRLSGAPMPKNVVPWMTAVSDYQEFSLWGESGKMNCPTWDLPAGGLYVGGTCPGADAGQTVVDPAKRRASLVADGSGRFFLRQTPPGVSSPPEMKEGGTICSQCITGDALIMVRGRGLCRIDSMLGQEFEVWSGVDWRTTRVKPMGMKSTVEVALANGQRVRATGDHRFLTQEGWVEAAQLEEDRLPIQLPKSSPFPKWARVIIPALGEQYRTEKRGEFPEFWSRELGVFLGYMVGDGSFSEARAYPTASLVAAERDADDLGRLASLVTKWTGSESEVVVRESDVSGLVSNGAPHAHVAWRSKSLTHLLHSLGLKKEGSATRTPAEVWNADEAGVAGYLSGLFSTDGSIGTSAGHTEISFANTAQTLVDEVQQLLAAFGIRTSRCEYASNRARGYLPLWKLSIKSIASVRRFAEVIGFFNERKQALLMKALENEKDVATRETTYRVESVVDTGKVEAVYDLLNVGPEAQFVVNGVTVHNCYAFEGNYPIPHVQLGEVLRYWWVRSMLEQGRASELVDTLVLSMKLIRYPETPYGILPVRIHSAGDFFSKDYAKVWCDVADELWRMGGNAARVRMWAPTRTWAQWGNGFWAEQLGSLASVRDGQAPNLMVRASAYNFNDAAPGAFHPTNAAGSTSLMQSQEEPRLARNAAAGIPTSSGEAFRPVPGEARYDWACPTYSIEQDKHTCSNATNPEGGVHCRACWVRPEWRVQYTAH
jgi:hypothetical protein